MNDRIIAICKENRMLHGNNDLIMEKSDGIQCYEGLISYLLQWKDLGVHRDEIGGIAIAKVPHIAPSAMAHRVFGPISLEQITELEQRVQCSLPDVLYEFYKHANGFRIFSDSVGMYGLRKSFARVGAFSTMYPYAIDTPNIHERPLWLPEGELIFGYYGNDGTQVSISDVGKITAYVCNNGDVDLISWADFPTWMSKEVRRIGYLFDKDCKLTADATMLSPIHAKRLL